MIQDIIVILLSYKHGNNPGLVSHFVKAAIEYIIHKQFRKDKTLKKIIKRAGNGMK